MSQTASVGGRQVKEPRIGRAMRSNFAVVIPALNESENIPELFGELDAAFRRHDLDGEIIYVDDGSTDDSFEVASREGARLSRFKLERHERNLGKTEALATGALAASSDWIVLFDADLQHLPEEIPRFLAEAEKGYDMVCGRKVGRYNKQLVSRIYNWLSRRMFQVPVRDLNSMKIFRKSVLEDVHLRHDWHRFFAVLAHSKGYKVGEIDVDLLPRRRGESKYYGSGRLLVGTLDLLAVWFQQRFSRKPMLFFWFTGLVLLTLAGVTGGVAVGMRLAGHGFRPLLDLVLLLSLVGVSLFGIGFVAEMVATLRAEVDDLRDVVRELKDRDKGGPVKGPGG